MRNWKEADAAVLRLMAKTARARRERARVDALVHLEMASYCNAQVESINNEIQVLELLAERIEGNAARRKK